MQQYNTQMPKVKLPEYGRNLQELVEYCKTIPDRDKRTRYAYGIVSIMGDLYPDADKVENLKQILWDHLALISNYELDIDYPVEIIPKDSLNVHPEILQNPQQQDIALRMYGKVVEDMIRKACQIEDQEQRIRLFERCANHMKLHFHLFGIAHVDEYAHQQGLVGIEGHFNGHLGAIVLGVLGTPFTQDALC